MMLGSKSRGGLFYSERIKGQNSLYGEQNWGFEGWKRILQPRNMSPSEAIEGITPSVDLLRSWGRPCFVGRNG